MPFQTQLALSLELAKVFPIREALNNGVRQLAKLVRALKRHGSDFLVEEDLADIFGRGKIEPSLEKSFRDVVKAPLIESLYAESPISLDAGPGATVGRALKDPFYISCVIQLSFLVWMHEETTLAATLVENMLTRYESNVHGATPDPDYEGILKALKACSSQTCQYHWDHLVSLVENRFPRSIQWFRLSHNPLRSLLPNLLLGLMDYLYMAQSLPEDRLIIIDNQMGLVPVVIWAHYILGLTVLIKNSPDGDVAFGQTENPQVIIKWSSKELFTRALNIADHKDLLSRPTIYLLDAEMQVHLETGPNDDQGTRIESQECHRLKGYDTTFLRRLFNGRTLISDDDQIYTDTANFAVAFALLLTKVMRRVPFSGQEIRRTPDQCSLSTEHWRLFDSGRLLFMEINLGRQQINEYLAYLTGKRLNEMKLPASIKTYLETAFEDNSNITRQWFIEAVKELASWILSFAQVINVGTCADLPLRIAPGWMFCTGVMNWEGLDKIDIPSTAFFNLIMKMMKKDVTNGVSILDSDGVFLTCHQGWSLFYNSVGDNDPGETNCELLSIRRGVPTNTRTGERRYQIADAPPFQQSVRTPARLDHEESYVSRCVTKVVKRTEHYSSRADEFWLSIRFDVEEVDFHHRTPLQRAGRDPKYPLYASYALFQEALWGVVRTKPCAHRFQNSRTISLDLDVVTAAGLTWSSGDGDIQGTRIVISLVKGDARSRWLVVNGLMATSEAGALNRQVLLRCNGCCEECAVRSASAMKGRWLVVL